MTGRGQYPARQAITHGTDHLTLDAAKAFLRLTWDDDDAQVAALIEASRAAARYAYNRPIVDESHVVEYTAPVGDRLHLPMPGLHGGAVTVVRGANLDPVPFQLDAPDPEVPVDVQLLEAVPPTEPVTVTVDVAGLRDAEAAHVAQARLFWIAANYQPESPDVLRKAQAAFEALLGGNARP